MKIVTTVSELVDIINDWQKNNQTIGLVATMGYLHEGHQSLIKKSAEENDRTVVSIFVNPTQFAPNEDLTSYPRDLENDCRLAENSGASLIFAPSAEEMYPNGFNSYVEVVGITDLLEGKSRPTHFRGVTTVVSKLFHLTCPTRAYFGQKDAQQVAVISQMVCDLNFPVQIVVCPIVREADGLAKSSRNTYLSKKERQAALVLSQTLSLAEELIKTGEWRVAAVIQKMTDFINNEPLAQIDYIEIVDAKTLNMAESFTQPVLILLAVKINQTRLIDNLLLV
ncbi:MAG: pantoate--beta-alanine ligase [Streptococcaceae bacterium]|jgi:pantoate--beta-alanine ligase|nr:pantoate--beta-alanine ligase [Streptococcaceae bacterium]